ncbi:Transcriptional regulator, LysR family (plasmid) [Neorhizobium galegae bv. officinalis bv. officinalis str. HAMBI 1141]|uniref:Transcriptional regulator, LysR family n=1 Tax=Neorhizobium galegae bv. officinalis bv. officinalis str. HAMBI 1141 TaxID=1028801 RepID=A0A068TGR2_NEOGA|nr:LysR family transcriptional regulator [Neorhizobium galegae]CDN57637.1 Transcriptional regulator, LysR family [Neorhizobium galegae bv. officinalis bv. officinalis str. HAMBI 1141]
MNSGPYLNLSLRQLRYICEVARLGTVLGASKSLRIAQSSILAAIDLAEAEIGSRIFERFPAKGIRVTPAGMRFINAARVMLSSEIEFARAIGGISERVPDVLRIGCFEPFGALFMPDLLQQYVDQIGKAEIDLREGNQRQLRDWLAAGEIEMAVLYEGDLFSSYSLTPICFIPPHAAIHVDDPLARRDAVTLKDLAQYPLVLLDLPETAPHILALFNILAEVPKIGFRTRSYETVLSAISSGFGMSLLNMRPLNQLKTDGPNIVRKPLLDDLPAAKLIIADLYGPEKPYFLQAFIDLCRTFFHELGPSRFAVSTSEREPYLLIR